MSVDNFENIHSSFSKNCSQFLSYQSPSEASDDSGVCEDSHSIFSPSIEDYLSFEVEIPAKLGGKLIGKGGKNVKELREKCNCKVILRQVNEKNNMQILVIKGNFSQISKCQQLLERKFPEIKMAEGVYYNLSGDVGVPGTPMDALPQSLPAVGSCYVQLPEGVICDVFISKIISATHFFIQQPNHPSYCNLPRLQRCMNYCYSDSSVPGLPGIPMVGAICSVSHEENWHRAQIVGIEDEQNIHVKLLDAGGILRVEHSCIKQIRSDFLSLPFQALEVYLNGVCPNPGECTFSEEALSHIHQLLYNSRVTAVLCGWNAIGMPLVDLFVHKDSVIKSVTESLIENSLVQQISPFTAM